jgi:glyoxylase-like metal-dependent hydrolase (beta-lactamase superfamily II)
MPGVERLTQNNPGLFSGPGTNTHLLGEHELFVLDPGERREDGHLEKILQAINGRTVLGVLPSHGHPDHWPLTVELADRLGAPVLFQRRSEEFRVDRVLRDGDVLAGRDVELHVLHTPGHAQDHLALHWPERRALFPGDHVMGWSTSIIAPPDGNLNDYMASLERLLLADPVEVLFPAHGEAIVEPRIRMRELLEHRRERSRQALAALGDGPATLSALVRRIYVDTPPELHPAAERSLWAHLSALEEAGQVGRLSRTGESSESSAPTFAEAAVATWTLL